MAETTAIEWADSTLNVWEGCQETGSPACVKCYAKARNARFNGGVAVNWGPRAPRREVKGWRAMLRKISRLALKERPGGQWLVFVNSLSDFWDNQADAALRAEALAEFAKHPHLTFLLLTKRPQNILRLFKAAITLDQEHDPLSEYWPANVAIGCTVVTQEEADRDLPFLLHAKRVLGAAMAFVSIEPMAAPIDLTRISTWKFPGAEVLNALTGALAGMFGDPAGHLAALDWVIAGGMSGHHATPSHPDWYRALRDQCAHAEVPFLFKQWGEWAACQANDGEWPTDLPGFKRLNLDGTVGPEGWPMQRVGKKHAGRRLDGVEHNARPAV